MALALVLWAGGAHADDGLDVITKGKMLFDSRVRWEDVQQDGFAKTADAVTLRTRFGLETAELFGTKTWALIEFEDIRNLAQQAYNSTANGKTKFPTIGDAAATELNRAQLTFTGIPDTTIIVGRQRILLDNQRFVGNAGFRQNEQTFDAVTAINKTLPDTELEYIYIDQVRRVFGPNSPTGRFPSSSNLFHAKYTGIFRQTISAYAYLLDLGPKSALNTQTYGIRAIGELPLDGGFSLTYAGEYAKQKNFRTNPKVLDLNYYLGETGLKYQMATAGVGYEVLGGNGAIGFSTPLATLFAFQGWDDAFLTTPTKGIKDLYLKAGYGWKGVPVVTAVNLQLVYHKYNADFGPGSYGHEWDALVSLPITPRWTVEARYADYTAGNLPGFAGRSKFWLSAQFKL
ncbi:MAG: hypothetical protein EPO08_19330 [Rhodospirillaceae bacterium]|nr:MAG: hypothetical protein EPO08_19330 [Rhodospirillaceae bacterium]